MSTLNMKAFVSQACFDEYDTDGSGKLNEEEMKVDTLCLQHLILLFMEVFTVLAL